MTAKKSKTIPALLSVIFLVLLLSGQCAAFEEDVLFQISTIDALMQGVFDGFYSFDALMAEGDFGIGTFDALEGVMVALDGNYYQVKADGVAYPVQLNMTAPAWPRR